MFFYISGILTVIGGQPDSYTYRKTELYSIHSNLSLTFLHRTDNSPDYVYNSGYAIVGSKVYIAGGRAGSGGDKVALVYAALTDTFTQLPDMVISRKTQGPVFVLSGSLYVGGGEYDNNEARLSKISLTDAGLTTGSWSVDPVPIHRSRIYDATAVVVGERVYIAGGRYNSGSLISWAANDPSWNTSYAGLNVPRQKHCVVYCRGSLWAIGGHSSMDSVEMYDFLNDQWIVKSPLPVGKSYPSCHCFQSNIIVVGGTPSGGTVYLYNIGLDLWQAYNDLLNRAIFGHVSIIV